MLFSIIVPVFNIEEYLDDCIMSVINQDFNDYELVLVNDGSSDNSLDICKKYKNNYSNIHIISKSNEGVTKARLSGALKAQGDYIISLDGDDLLEKHTLSRLYEIVESYWPDSIIYDMESFGGKNKHLQKNLIDEGLYEEEKLKKIIGGYIYDKTMPGLNSGCILPSAGGKAIRKDIYISSINSVPKNIFQAEDLIQNLEVLLQSRKVYVLHEALYKYRTRMASVSYNVTIAHLDNIFRVFEYLTTNYRQFYNQIGAYMVIRTWNIVARLHDKKVPFKEIYNHVKNAESHLSTLDISWGQLSPTEKLKVNIVTRRKRYLWAILLALKY